MAQWYIQDDMFEQGPFSAKEMRCKVTTGEVVAVTLVRKDTAKKFMAARSYKGLIPEKTDSTSSNAIDNIKDTTEDMSSLDLETKNTSLDTPGNPFDHAPKTAEISDRTSNADNDANKNVLPTSITARMVSDGSAMRTLSAVYLVSALCALGFFIFLAL